MSKLRTYPICFYAKNTDQTFQIKNVPHTHLPYVLLSNVIVDLDQWQV